MTTSTQFPTNDVLTPYRFIYENTESAFDLQLNSNFHQTSQRGGETFSTNNSGTIV